VQCKLLPLHGASFCRLMARVCCHMALICHLMARILPPYKFFEVQYKSLLHFYWECVCNSLSMDSLLLSKRNTCYNLFKDLKTNVLYQINCHKEWGTKIEVLTVFFNFPGTVM
jgi:hypothetical protein